MPKRDRAVNNYFEKKPKAPRPSASFQHRSELTSLKQTEITAYFSTASNQRQDHLVQQAVVDSVKEGKHPQLRHLLDGTDWKDTFAEEFDKNYFNELQTFLESEWDNPRIIVYPTARLIFDAFLSTPFKDVRVVLLGQDPYHGERQATGRSFSVPKNVKIPSSLQNIYKEIRSDLGYHPGRHGDLYKWTHQGVLLLNTVLTVRAAEAHSHKKKGWETFTQRVIEVLNEEKSNLVFLLWGTHAQKMGASVDENKHLVLKAAHPSGLSAHKGFFGCKHFSKCNEYLEAKGSMAIDWRV